MYNISDLDVLSKHDDFVVTKHKKIFSVSLYKDNVAYCGRNADLSSAIFEAVRAMTRSQIENEQIHPQKN